MNNRTSASGLDMGILCANLAWVMACLPSWLLFRLALYFPRLTQERRLRALLRRHRDTDFGRQHGFAALQSAAAFAARVPLAEYSDFAAAIAALRRGEPSPRGAEPVLLLEPTSGSTGAPKLIPYTAALRREFQAAIQPWLAALYLVRPRLLCGRHYWSISPNTVLVATASAGPDAIPVGFADDAEYLGPVQRRLARWLFAVPPEIRRVTDPETFTHLTLLFLLHERNLRLISVWHPSFLTLLLDALPAHLPTLLCELRSGRIDAGLVLEPDLRQRLQAGLSATPARAAEVAATASDPGAFGRLWPRLQVISCWTDGWTSPWVERLRHGFPGVLLQGKGLLATEGVVTIPIGRGDARVCALRSHFLEFVEPLTGALRCLWELEPGHDYSVVLTTGGGLWRYRLHDLVRVSGICGRTPCLIFLGKDNAVVDLVGEKLHEQHVAAALSAAADATGILPAFAMLAPTITGRRCRYLLFLELSSAAATAETARFAAAVEAELCRNYHYAHARRLQQLGAVEPFRLCGNAMAAYRAALVAAGIKAGDVKLPALRGESFWPNVFAPPGGTPPAGMGPTLEET